MSSWTDRMPPLGKKRTGFGPHPESEHPGQMRLECRSRTAISCDSRERREQHFRRPAEKGERFWPHPKNQKTPEKRREGKNGKSHFLERPTRKEKAFRKTGKKTGKVEDKPRKETT